MDICLPYFCHFSCLFSVQRSTPSVRILQNISENSWFSVKTTAHGASMGQNINGGAQEDIMHHYLVDMSS